MNVESSLESISVSGAASRATLEPSYDGGEGGEGGQNGFADDVDDGGQGLPESIADLPSDDDVVAEAVPAKTAPRTPSRWNLWWEWAHSLTSQDAWEFALWLWALVVGFVCIIGLKGKVRRRNSREALKRWWRERKMNEVDHESGSSRTHGQQWFIGLWHEYFGRVFACIVVALLFILVIWAFFWLLGPEPTLPGLEKEIKSLRPQRVDTGLVFTRAEAMNLRASVCIAVIPEEMRQGKLRTGHFVSDVWSAMRGHLYGGGKIGVVGVHLKQNQCVLMMRRDSSAGSEVIAMLNPVVYSSTSARVRVAETSLFCEEVGAIEVLRPKEVRIDYLAEAAGNAPQSVVLKGRDAIVAGALIDQLNGHSICDLQNDRHVSL